jgi:hypothetical protein
MVVKNQDSSFNDQVKPSKLYSRIIYWCKKDDVWVSVEVPKEERL